MPAAAPALSREAAVEIITAMPFLVAASNSKLKPGTVVWSEYEVSSGPATYKFEKQPLYVVRELTFREYRDAVPAGMKGLSWCRFYYEVGTD